MTKKSLKINQVVRDCTYIQENKINYLKREGFQVIKERISNRLKVYSKYMKKNTGKGILNYYYYVKNGTLLCDKEILLQ